MNNLNVNIDLYRLSGMYRGLVGNILNARDYREDYEEHEEYNRRLMRSIELFFFTDAVTSGYGCLELVNDAVEDWKDVEGVIPERGRRGVMGMYKCRIEFKALYREPVCMTDMIETELPKRLLNLWQNIKPNKPSLGLYLRLERPPGPGAHVLTFSVYLSKKPPVGDWRKL